MLCWLDINKTKNRNVFVYTNINNMYADVERSMSKNYYYIKNVSVGPINDFFRQCICVIIIVQVKNKSRHMCDKHICVIGLFIIVKPKMIRICIIFLFTQHLHVR